MMLEEIAAYLDAQTSLTAAVNLFAVEMPPKPDACVSLHQYDGLGPVDTFRNSSAYEDTRLHIRVRAATFPSAMALADIVHGALYDITDQTIGGHLYHRVRQQGSWTVIEIDTDSRVVVKSNYEVLRVP